MDVLEHDDGVIDHEADGEHEGQQRQDADGQAQRREHDAGANQRNRHRHGGNQRGAHRAKEEVNHRHDEQARDPDGNRHFMQRAFDEFG